MPIIRVNARGATPVLPQIWSGMVSCVILMNGAVHQSRARAALTSSGGRRVEMFNITSGENWIFEVTLWSRQRCDRALGRGFDRVNALTLRIDCSKVLVALQALGIEIAPPQYPVCHWSIHLRPGVFSLYQKLTRDPDAFLIDRLCHAISMHALQPETTKGRPRPCALLPGWEKSAS